ncbi:MAG TPA: hypothetical protein VEV45_05870 [Streptosporangiaceae bacterium]|nr:hypothetical protein [Streptosporangiaceae bacterium]
MSSGTTAVIIALAVVVIVAAAAMAATARRQAQRRFGREDDRAVGRRVRKLNIGRLPDAARRQHLAEWRAIQEQFVDSPESAVTEAYSLVTTVMQECGYPVDDDEQVTADLPVDHARTVSNFRSAQTITREAAHGSVATEDMREALIQYRELFADLLGEPTDL